MIEGFAREMPEDRMVEAVAGGPRVHPRDVRPAAGAGREGGSPRRRSSSPRRPTACGTTLSEQLLRRAARGQADRGQAGPGRGLPCGQGSRRSRRDDSRSGGRGRRSPGARSRKAWHDLEEQVVRDLILAGTRADGRDAQDAASHRLRGRPAAARARLGPVPAGRDAGAGHGHAGHRPRRAARRRADRGVLARSSCSTTTSRRSRWASAGRSAARAAAKSATARWPSGASSRCCPTPTTSPTRSASSPTSSSRTAPVRWPASAAPRWA